MNAFDLRGSNRAHARRIAHWLRFVAAALLLSIALHAPSVHAGAIVVGRGPDCTVPTIREAIQRANGFGGYNLILVTDEVPDGVYHENLLLQNLREDLVLELVGGYADCTTLAPTAFGKASLYGGDVNRPTLRLRGYNVATFRGFWMQGGAGEGDYGGGGIDFQGYGSLVLENVRVAESDQLGGHGAGIHVIGQNGTAALTLNGRVEVTDQHSAEAMGVSLFGTSVLLMRGDNNSIRDNTGTGIYVEAPAVADIGATGPIVSNNNIGIVSKAEFRGAGSVSRLYSIDPANPLRITGNRAGALDVYAQETSSPNVVCARNTVVENNVGQPIKAYGNTASIEINPDHNDVCAFPPAADIHCPADRPCNLIVGNQAAANTALVAASTDASIALNNVMFMYNRAVSLLSTNRGQPASAAAITMTGSVVLANTLDYALFEAIRGGIVDIWDSTIGGNDGGFGFSLFGNDPSLLQVTNSIIDQPQTLVYLNNGPIETTHFNRVLARNRSGATATDDILVGQPTYRDAYGRLAPDSPGVDYAPAGGGTDFDGNPRDVDTVNLPDWLGPRDLGAFESQVTLLDRILTDGFDTVAPVL